MTTVTPERKEIMPEVYLTCCEDHKFKTGLLSAQIITPLRRDTASACALLPSVLQRGTVRYPDMEQIGAALDEMYGAGLKVMVRKRGEALCVGFGIDFVDDILLGRQEKLLERCALFLGELFLQPVTRGGRFLSEYVASEKENLIHAIAGLRNDKREWADLRLIREMCADEPYGVDRWGDEESVRKLNQRTLYEEYRRLLCNSRMELFYSGSAAARTVEDALRDAFAPMPRGTVLPLPPLVRRSAPEEPRHITETMDVEQSRLAAGFRCGSLDAPAMMIASLLFGGSGNSKLFRNVREEKSLCYYISSAFVRSKNIMTLCAGIDSDAKDRVLDAAAGEWAAICRGEIEDWELTAAKKGAVSYLRSLGDSQSATENYYIGQAATGLSEQPEELAQSLLEVTGERVMAAAATVKLDTVYFLQGGDPQ